MARNKCIPLESSAAVPAGTYNSKYVTYHQKSNTAAQQSHPPCICMSCSTTSLISEMSLFGRVEDVERDG